MGVSGQRYYSPSQGRFLGRDPKQEAGGVNLYGFVRNNPINAWDYLGMSMMAAVSTNTKVETYADEEGEWEVQYSDVSDVAYGIPEWVEDGRVLVRPATTLINSDPNSAARDNGSGVGSAIHQGALDFQKGLTGFGAGNVNSPSGQLGKGTGLALILAPVSELFNAARALLVARAAAAVTLPNGSGIGIVQNGSVLVADLSVSTSHQALAARAGVLGADGTLTGGAQAIIWTVENGVIRTTASINFPSQTGTATEQAVQQFLQALAKANGGG